MECTIPGIPEYLHFREDKKTYSSKDFKRYHLLYSTGTKEKSNPIEFPNTLTAISVCWSKLIRRDHVLNVVRSLAKNPDGRGNHVYYGKVSNIHSFKVEGEYPDGDYKGKHVLTTEITHSPIACNYAHAEILIKHVYQIGGTPKIEIISKESFDKKTCILRKGHNSFFKPLLLQYRAKMATMMNTSINELDTAWYIKIMPKNLIVTVSLWKVMTINSR